MSTRSSSVPDTDAPARIVLVDNTAPPSLGLPSTVRDGTESPPHEGVASVSSRLSRRSDGDGKRETLRKAIAERRYKRWSVDPNSAEATETEGEEDEEIEPSPDSRAAGVVLPRAPAEEIGGGDGAEDEGSGSSGEPHRTQRPSHGVLNDTAGPTNGYQKRRPGRREREKEVAEIDVLYENQRGWYLCGIPLFSNKSLLNFDPSAWQNKHFHDSAVSIVNAQVPDPSWVWDWKSWYVDMTTDVDEEGWAYSFSFSPSFAWHGNHVWFHSFVRRRRWLRKRVKVPSVQNGTTTRSPSTERGAHGLNNDYFTIHSRRERSSWHASGTNGNSHRRSVLEGGSDWGGTAADSDSLSDLADLRDIPTLLRIVKRARLDREKVEAILRFAMDATEELAYLPENMHTLMSWMIFQASRRQLLAHLTAYADRFEAGDEGAFTLPTDELSMPNLIDSQPVSPLPESPHQPLLPDPSMPPPESEVPPMGSERKKKLDALRRSIVAADENVRRLEYWSDKKEVARRGESTGAEGEWEEGLLGISGADTHMKARDKGKGRAV
ncbi:hypothetical protein EDC01DRAFT_78600 [Geopyxis carbonaria]|nr:hypothetical protein EDC01DRAFT_78600 [Geopyxis carbonaria]